MNRAAWIGLVTAVAALWWWGHGPSPFEPHAVAAARPMPQPLAPRSGVERVASSPAPPLSAQGARERATQVALWRERLDRATQTLDAYRAHTRYPAGSRPASEQADQLQPYAPVTEDHALKLPGRDADDSVKLRVVQERLFLQGEESARVTLSLVDAQGQAQPLRVSRATLREVTAGTQGSLFPTVPVLFNDDGSDADAAAADRVHSTRVHPSSQGFAGLTGAMRLEVWLEHRGAKGYAQGFTYFDFIVTATPPATWAGAVRESTEGGSLNFDLPVRVREAGRYVVTGVVDDANGRPYAHLTYNDSMAAGDGQFRLRLFGKLLHDAPPAFPLTLSDVVAFRLREEGHPDRLLMPQRAGPVHVTARHALSSFSAEEWTDDARQRYLAELSKDVEEARRRLTELGS